MYCGVSLGDRLTGRHHTEGRQWDRGRVQTRRPYLSLGSVIEGRYFPNYLFNQPNVRPPDLID